MMMLTDAAHELSLREVVAKAPTSKQESQLQKLARIDEAIAAIDDLLENRK